jgi:hypothetical protein
MHQFQIQRIFDIFLAKSFTLGVIPHAFQHGSKTAQVVMYEVNRLPEVDYGLDW